MLGRAFLWSRKQPVLDERVFIKGEKVVLREKGIEDARDDYAWRVDEELASLDGTRPLNMSYEDFLKYAREDLAFPSTQSKRLAIDTHEGKHIGNCMYYDIDLRQGEAEMGIMIGERDFWSKGYGTDSVDSLLNHIFSTTPLTRVYLHTLEWNHRARRCFAKSGFREVKRVRRSRKDFILMEVWRAEWEGSQRSKQKSAEDGHAGATVGNAVSDLDITSK